MTDNIPQEEILDAVATPLGGGDVLLTAVVRDETYSFTPDDGSPEIHIWSGRLVRWLHENALDKVIDLTFPQESLQDILARNGVCVNRADALTPEQLAAPVVVGLYHDGSGILIDGAHRRYRHARQGNHVLRGWAVPPEIWQLFTFNLEDVIGVIHDRN